MTTEIIAFSDHHAHNFQYGAERVEGSIDYKPGFYNSRFLYSIKVLEEISLYARGKDAILFGGDLFHQRGAVSTDVLFGTYQAIKRMSWYHGGAMCMIPGNHDYSDRAGSIHSLLGLKSEEEYAPTIQDSSWSLYEVKDEKEPWNIKVNIWTIPYQESKENFKLAIKDLRKLMLSTNKSAKFNILLAHQGIQGSIVGSDFVLSSQHDISVDDIPDWFNLCLFGHYHKHQKIKDNAYYIGASHQHNWGDANDPRGFLHITINDDFTYDLKQIETQSAPKFVITDKPIKCRSIDFVKSTNEKLTAKDLGNPKVFENIEVSMDEDTKEFVPPSHSVDDILQTWVTLQGATQEHLEMGKFIIKETKHDL